MTRRERAYERMLQELIHKAGRLRDKQARKVMAILETTRKDVAAAIASTPWQAAYIPQMKEAVGRAIEGFRQRYLAEQSEALGNAWNAGIDAVDSPLQYAGVAVLAPEISRTALEIAQGYSADLIGGLSADALKKVNFEILQGVMGQKPLQEVMGAIGRGLDDPGVFKSLAYRAETIARTEMAGVHSAARAARGQALLEGQTDPPMRLAKKWISSGKAHPRPNHAALDGMVVPIDQDFPGGIPYPHAPGLSAKEKINCGCTHVIISLDWDDMPRSYQPVPYEERAIYN